MQDVHPIGTTAGKALADRRHHHHTAAAALRCPRCESTNTKFCYYNNYNLSQPRHFCKNCRRYWTNGGVLRNVPVGGGSRKSTKRSKPKPKISTAAASTTTASSGGGGGERNDVVLEQTASAEAKRVERVLVTPDIGGVVTVRSDSDPGPNSNSNLNPDPFGFGELLPTEEWEIGGAQQEDKMRGLAGGIDLDPTHRIEYLLQSSRIDGGVVALDWQGNDHNGLGFFDDQSCWIQGTTSFDDHHLQQQWPDNHSNATNNDSLSLFLP